MVKDKEVLSSSDSGYFSSTGWNEECIKVFKESGIELRNEIKGHFRNFKENLEDEDLENYENLIFEFKNNCKKSLHKLSGELSKLYFSKATIEFSWKLVDDVAIEENINPRVKSEEVKKLKREGSALRSIAYKSASLKEGFIYCLISEYENEGQYKDLRIEDILSYVDTCGNNFLHCLATAIINVNEVSDFYNYLPIYKSLLKLYPSLNDSLNWSRLKPTDIIKASEFGDYYEEGEFSVIEV